MTHDHPRADPFRLLHVSSAIVVGETGAICVALWRGAATRSPFELQRSGLADVVRRHPAGVGFLCVVEKSSVPPDEELRRASMRMIESQGECLKCVATVIEADGFVGSVARGVAG